MDDVLVLLGGVRPVADVPAEGLEEGVDELDAQPRLFVGRALETLEPAPEGVDQLPVRRRPSSFAVWNMATTSSRCAMWA